MKRCDGRKSCCPLRRWAKRFFVGLLVFLVLAVPIVYLGAPKVGRTEWAKTRAEREASKALGMPVNIQRMEFSWSEGITAHDVRTGPMDFGDMQARWTASEVQLKIKSSELLSRHPKGTAILRRPTMEMKWREETAPPRAIPPASPSLARGRFQSLQLYGFVVERGSVLIDNPSFGNPVRIDDIQAAGELDARRDHVDLTVSAFSAKLNDGTVSARGKLEIRKSEANGRISLGCDDVDVNQFVVKSIRNLQPMIEVEDGGVQKGKLQVRLDGQGTAGSLGSLLDAFRGQGQINLSSAAIHRSRLMHAVGDHAGLPYLVTTSFHTLTESFTLESGKFTIASEAKASEGSLLVAGWVALTGELDILVGLDPRLGQGPRAPARVTGTVSHPEAVR